MIKKRILGQYFYTLQQTTYPGGSKAEFLLGRKNLRLEEVLQAIPLKISRLQMHDFILALTGEGDEKKERQAFEQLLLRSQNIELNAVEMDQETEQLIHNLGNDGFLGKIKSTRIHPTSQPNIWLYLLVKW